MSEHRSNFPADTVDFFYDRYFREEAGHKSWTDEQVTFSVNKDDIEDCLANMRKILYKHFGMEVGEDGQKHYRLFDSQLGSYVKNITFVDGGKARTGLDWTEDELRDKFVCYAATDDMENKYIEHLQNCSFDSFRVEVSKVWEMIIEKGD